MATDVTVRCGACGGEVYMSTCVIHSPDDPWVTHSTCRRCGIVHYIGCEACFPARPHSATLK